MNEYKIEGEGLMKYVALCYDRGQSREEVIEGLIVLGLKEEVIEEYL